MTTDKAVKEIVILGGSYVGLQVSHYILKHVIPVLPANEYHVSLIDRSTNFFARVGAPRAIVSEQALGIDKIFYPIEDGFKSYSKDIFSFTQATVTGLDTSARTVNLTLPDGTETVKSYYALVIATGSSPVTPLLGLSGSYTDSLAAINAFRERLAKDPPKSIIIAGGGPAGIETAGELGEFLNGKAGYFSSKPAVIKTKITVITSNKQILPVLRPSLGKRAETLLNKVGVDVRYNTTVISTVPENAGQLDASRGFAPVLAKAQVKLDNGEVLDTDIYIPAVGTPPNTQWVPKNLLKANGKIDVNQKTFRLDAAGKLVYVIGDAGNFPRAGLFDLLFAFPSAINNVKRDLVHYSIAEPTGTVKDVIYESKPDESQFVPIGHIGGVGAFAGWSIPGFFVWLAKGRDYLSGQVPPTVNGDQWAKEKVLA
jgi:NADH dehydrogenase FAD-containing subunit